MPLSVPWSYWHGRDMHDLNLSSAVLFIQFKCFIGRMSKKRPDPLIVTNESHIAEVKLMRDIHILKFSLGSSATRKTGESCGLSVFTKIGKHFKNIIPCQKNCTDRKMTEYVIYFFYCCSSCLDFASPWRFYRVPVIHLEIPCLQVAGVQY